MKILFDLTALYDHLTGIERFAMNISKNIISQHPENTYVLVFKHEIHEQYLAEKNQDNVECVILPKCHKLVFYQWRLMRTLYKIKADRYVFLSFVSPWLFRNKNIINTIHDISAWDCPGSRKAYMVLYGRIGIRNALRNSKKIVTVSEFSKERIVKRLNGNANNINVVYNGVSKQFMEFSADAAEMNKIKEKYHLPKRYILCLSTLEPRKNMKLLIEAYGELISEQKIDTELVLAGRKGWKLDQAVGDNAQLSDKIHITGFIDDDDLPAIYKGAELFVFPSLYEGFGIPVIEAMSQGTIVVSSDSSSLPEVVGDAGFLFKSKDKESLKRCIIKTLNLNNIEHKLVVDKELEQSKKFDWSKEAEKMYKCTLQKADI